jgi:carboxyl-terminal processing protease
MVIDLRGNPGGSLYDAMDAAGLFLGEGAFIAGVRTRDQLREHRTTKSARFPDGDLWLLQDERTASSAELFIAALTENGRARSLGTRTVGKGSTQSMIPLTDGAALLLTVGELLAPEGMRYDGVGLEPSVPLTLEAETLEEQVRQVLNISP